MIDLLKKLDILNVSEDVKGDQLKSAIDMVMAKYPEFKYTYEDERITVLNDKGEEYFHQDNVASLKDVKWFATKRMAEKAEEYKVNLGRDKLYKSLVPQWAKQLPAGWRVVDDQILNMSSDVQRHGEQAYTIRNAADTVELIFNFVDQWDKWSDEPKDQIGFVGTTNFYSPSKKKWYTFDRTGVDSSFKGHTGVPLTQYAEEQEKRALESITKNASSETIPEIGIDISPERKVEKTSDLKAGKTVTFMPAGFGTGYELSTSQRGRYGAKRGSKELADFFGVPTIYVSTFDAD